MATHPSSLVPHPSGEIGLLGGTFDPPHIAHLFLAECARHQLGLERVVFIPAGDPWRKTSDERRATSDEGGGRDSGLRTQDSGRPRRVSPAAVRLEMVRLAVAGNEAFVVDDREVRRAGPSYTVDTLDELRAEGHANLVLILGSDALADMPNWKDPERIPTLARLAVAEKWEEGRGKREKRQGRIGNRKSKIENLLMPRLDISSTLIRTRAAAGLPFRYLVPEAVFAYIEAHRLYRDEE